MLSAMSSGWVLVVHTTASLNTLAPLAARARHVEVVDAAVGGGPHDIADGRLTLFVGGAEAAVDRVRAVLGCYADPVLHVGPAGAGQTVKLVNNALFGGQIGLLGEAIRLGERLGVPESTLLTALGHGSATSRVLNLGRGGRVGRVVHRGCGRLRGQRRGSYARYRRGTGLRSGRPGGRHQDHRCREEGLKYQRFGLSGSS